MQPAPPSEGQSEASFELRTPRLRLRRAPMAAAAVWFALGIAVAHQQQSQYLNVPTLFLLAGFLLLGTISVAALGTRVVWVGVAGVWVALGVMAQEWNPGPETPVALMHYTDNLSRTVTGTILRVHAPPPVPAVDLNDADKVAPWESSEEMPGSGALPSIDLALDAIEDVTPDVSRMVAASGTVRVSLHHGEPAEMRAGCGDRVEVPVRLRPPQRFRDPGVFQYADFLAGQGIALETSAAAANVRIIGASTPTLRCRLFAAQQWASGRLTGFADSDANRQMPPLFRLSRSDALMLNAMLFGDRSGLSHGLRVGFERTGSFHLFVVSGLHIALLAGAVFWMLRRVRLPLWLATFLTILAATAYAALTGFGQPAQRSLVMVSVFLVARLIAREHNALNALGAAVLALLVWSPASLFEASFQMTALAIVAIAGIAVPLGDYTFLRLARFADEVYSEQQRYRSPRDSQVVLMLEVRGEIVAELLGERARRLPAAIFRAILWVFELVLIATVAELIMVLPMALYFHRAAVFALPANMVVIPVIALLAPAAIAMFLCSLVSPWLAVVPGAATAAMLHGVVWTIHRLSHLDIADVRVPGPVAGVAVLALVGWLVCCWAVRRSRLGALATALALPLIAAMVLWPEAPVRTAGALELTAIDVGQGDSLLAVEPDGRTMLIDAGGPVGGVTSNYDIGEEVVSPYLWSRRLRRLDVVVLSHAHSDHMGGIPAVLENFRPRELWVGSDPGSAAYAALVQQAARLGIQVRHLHAGDRVTLGAVQVLALAPAAKYVNTAAPSNDDSLVLRLQLGNASVLLEGDAERPSEEAMLAAGLVTPVTLLKVGHHGSRTSSTQAFVDAAAPQDAVVSVGSRNTFGHPRGEVIARFAEHGTHLFRTDRFGLTSFFLTPDGAIQERVGETALPARALPSTR